MEELRSTDVLDKEIASDARRKAERILQRADASGQALLDAVPGRVEDARKKMEAGLNERVALFKKNADASIPLEKERFYVSFVQEAISNAMEAFIAGCTKDRLLSFVMTRYNMSKAALGDEALHAIFVGLDEAKARKTLEKAGAKIKSSESREAKNPLDTGVILEGENVKARITIAEMVSDLEDDKRAELSSALFGGGLKGAA